MKIGFVIPLMGDYDVEKAYNNIEKACFDCKVDFDVLFAINANLNGLFTDIRNQFIENSRVKAFMLNNAVDEHKLITIAMSKCEKYDATIIYSGKELVNNDVVRAFITSWQAGNKIVYLKKVYTGIKKIWYSLKDFFYRMGMKMVGLYRDVMAENDIQLLDLDVVKTINQLPAKNQQLRTLDSFIGYNMDTIHIEISEKQKEDPAYKTPSKTYLTAKILCMVFFFVALAGLVVSILALALKWPVPFYVHIILWTLFIIMSILSFLYNTKRTLALRVGEMIDVAELESIKEKSETYNL